jgi:hypothetical protein
MFTPVMVCTVSRLERRRGFGGGRKFSGNHCTPNIFSPWGTLRPYLLKELSPSWEAAHCAATQELPSTLWNPKVLYRVHKSPSLVPILSQIDSVHAIPSLRTILILSTHLRLGLHSGLFPSGFPTNMLFLLNGIKVKRLLQLTTEEQHGTVTTVNV